MENFGFSNSLCAQATWAITNHAPIGEYHLCFFPRENFKCPCGLYPIETKHHILYDCRRFNKGWNSRRETISQFISFLENNLNAFSKGESITKALHSQIAIIFSWFYFFLFLFLFLFPLFFFFLFVLLCSVHLYVCSYEVATMVCHHAPCNKLLN